MNQVSIQNKVSSFREVFSPKSEKSGPSSSSLSVTSEKEQFVQDLKLWATYDKQIKLLGDKMKELRNNKTELGNKITGFMQEKKIQDKPIELTDGQIRFIERKEYSPLTFSYIEECLDKILGDKSQVEYVVQYIREHRKITQVAELKRTYTSTD